MGRSYKNSYRINIEHNLDNAKGSRHGHTLEIILIIEHPAAAFFLSYPELDETVHHYLDEYDAKYLNEMKRFDSLPPTLENLGDILFEELNLLLRAKGLHLIALEISETPLRVYIVSAPSTGFPV